MSPFANMRAFLMRNERPTYVFWLLLLGSVGIAVVKPTYDSDLY